MVFSWHGMKCDARLDKGVIICKANLSLLRGITFGADMARQNTVRLGPIKFDIFWGDHFHTPQNTETFNLNNSSPIQLFMLEEVWRCYHYQD
jgi:hypothetical protein